MQPLTTTRLAERRPLFAIAGNWNLALRLAWLASAMILLSLIARPAYVLLAAPQAQEPVWRITSPTQGSTLSGEVAIQGTVTHPNFVSYGLLYATGTEVTGETSWRHDDPIAWDVRSMVVNGVLGTWDTTTLPNGRYVLALAVYVGDETPQVFFVSNLAIANEEATPTPEPTETPESTDPDQTELPLDPVPEAGTLPPAPTLQQPPTATPRPAPTPDPAAPVTEDGPPSADGLGLFSGEILSMEAIREAFLLGAQLALLLYAVGILYTLAKAVIRYYLRQTGGKPSR